MRLPESSITPNLMFFPKFFQKMSYLSTSSSSYSSSFSCFSSYYSLSSCYLSLSACSSSSSYSYYSSAKSRIMSMAFLTIFLLITLISFIYWSCSRDTLSGKSSESTTPVMKLRYFGIRSSNSSEISTRRT